MMTRHFRTTETLPETRHPRAEQHKLRGVLGLACASTLLLTACADADGNQEPATTDPDDGAGTDATGQDDGGVEDDLPFEIQERGTYDAPWALEFLPGTEQLLITTRTGELILRDVDGESELTVEGVPDDVVVEGQGGLGDVVAGPDFEQDSSIYLSWVTEGDGGTGAVLGRATLVEADDSAQLEDLEVIWEQEPKTSGSGHFAHRVAFSPDGEHMFVTSGDRQQLSPAQDLDSGLGKTMRLTLEGEPAPGNPFADQGGVSEQIWTYGHRNHLGIGFAPDGTLWSSEMGPAGGDELNIISEGQNYGWPQVSNGAHYDGEEIPDHSEDDDFRAPEAWWTPAISPGSLMIYDDELFPQWQGDAFLGALSGEALVHVELDGEEAGEQQIWDMGARIRDVAQGPDGGIWIVEDGDDARLLELIPSED